MTRSTGYAAARRELREQGLVRCPACKEVKPFSEYHASKSASTTGLQSRCKPCAAAVQSERNAKKRAAKALAKSLIDPTVKTCGKCKETLPVELFRLRTQAGRTHQRYTTCNACWKAKTSEWSKANAERARELNRAWAAKNPDHTRKVYREARKRRLKNPVYRIHSRITCQIWHVLRGKKRGQKAEHLIGYPMSELAAHLERQFVRGMGWHNIGQWHIDHIVPLSSFTITGPDDPELRRAWALTNLRPLWAEDNASKRDKRTHLL